MARVAVALSCAADVMGELERLSRSRSGEVRLAERAHIVLACLQGSCSVTAPGASAPTPNLRPRPPT